MLSPFAVAFTFYFCSHLLLSVSPFAAVINFTFASLTSTFYCHFTNPFPQTTNAESQRLLQVNLISHMVLIRAFLPAMLTQRKGHIVTIASMASFVPAPGLVDYCISKIGALYLTEGLRAECLAHYGPAGRSICTTSIHPSWHQTGILKNAGKDLLEKHGIVPDPPQRVSEVVLEQVLKGRSGRLCVPRDQEKHMGVRGWPRWAQDLAFGLVWSKNAGTFAELAVEHEARGGRG